MALSRLFDVTLTLHFKVQGSDMYGGEGSIGYAEQSMGRVEKPENADDDIAESIRASMAAMLGVGPECLEFISAQEYEVATANDDDDDPGDWDDL